MNFKGFYIKKVLVSRVSAQVSVASLRVCRGRPCVEELGLIPSRDVPVAPGGAGICSVACGGPQAGAGGCSLKDVS